MPSPDLTRRSLLRGAAVAGVTSGVAADARAMIGGGRAVVDLRVDHLTAPLAIEGKAPRLSWLTEAFTPIGYRILVASQPERLAHGRADLWDSGDVTSAATFDVAYRGRALAPFDQAFWLVEAIAADGPRVRSAMSSWRVGIGPQDWCGEWLAAEHEDIAGDRVTGLSWIWGGEPTAITTQFFRRRFDITEPGVGSVLQVVARDTLDGVWLNGLPVQRPELRPPVVNNARMETIALPLARGTNEVIVAATYRPDRSPKSPTGGMAAVLRVCHADGKFERLSTREGWETTSSPTGMPSTSAIWSRAVRAGSRPRNDPWVGGPAMLLRRRFISSGDVVRAILYASALGSYYAHLNGARVSNALLAPESTDFIKRALYQAYDVTHLLRDGDNMLGAIVGDGWYGSTGLFGGRYDFGPAPNRFRAHLLIERSDGSRRVIATDPDWQTAPSAVLASEIYDGEVYDARRERPRWDQPDASDAGWQQARPAPTPDIAITAQPDAAIKVTRTLQPVSVKTIRAGVHVFDFGQNFAGWCRLKAIAPAGTTVTLRHAEILAASGEVDQSNLRSAMARDVYIFRGGGTETYIPHFTYHGFRYVQVQGWSGTLPPGFLTAEVIGTALAETGTFHIDDPLISKLWRNTLWSQRSNFVGIPTDCPQRDERLGWMGDAQVFWDAASFNMDTAAFTRRFMADVRDGQAPNGAFAEYNPQSALAGMKGAPGWADAGVLLPWMAWCRYGDTAIIDENWKAMTAYADHVLAANPTFLWRNARGTDYGDWLALDAKQPGDPTTPKDLVATAMWCKATRCLAEMAEATGRDGAARDLQRRHARIVAAFRTAFIAADGHIGNGSQTGYLLAFANGLIPEGVRGRAATFLTADIRRRGNVLSTGFLGTPIALDVLLDLGERDLVLALLRRTEFPSWGYMVAKGATTIWERWNGDTGDVAMNSFNHYALGAIVGFFYRRLAGIDVATASFATTRIAPDMWVGFGSAGATYDSQVGRIETNWRRRGSRATLHVAIPSNARGELHLPAGPSRSAALNGRPLLRSGSDYVGDLAPGRHTIEVK